MRKLLSCALVLVAAGFAAPASATGGGMMGCADCLENGACVFNLPWGYNGCNHTLGACSIVPYAQCWPGEEDAEFAMDGTVHLDEAVVTEGDCDIVDTFQGRTAVGALVAAIL